MAERRMFAKSIIDSDAFLDMPLSTQCLYFHLAMRADDDGFVNSPQRIMRLISATRNDMDLLIAKNFVIPFESGICVIKHWRIHNYLRSDRYKPTSYTDEKAMLTVKGNGSYELGIPSGIPLVDAGKDSIGKDSIGKDSDANFHTMANFATPTQSTDTRFKKPTVEEIAEYCRERNNGIDAQRFFDYYEAKGWLIGKTKMKDWRAAVRTWERVSGAGAGTATRGGKIDYEAEMTEKEREWLKGLDRDGD